MNESAKPTKQVRARRWLTLGAFGLLFGIALSALGQGPIGGWISVAAAVAMIIGLHTYGRLGPDAPDPVSAERAPKRQKSRKKRKSSPIHPPN